MSESGKAVFLSYAHEDTAAARRIADALRGFGIEVWFDQSELRGGDAWDQKIRGQIKDCALFVPVISTHTESRGEGYFRLEWKLADERTHLMAKGVPLLVPVVIDDTGDGDAMVPDSFRAVQWTRLAGGTPSPEFVAQIKRLLEAPRKPAAAKKAGPAASAAASSAPAKSGFSTWAIATLSVIVLGLMAFIALRPAAKEKAPATGLAKPVAETKTAPPALAPDAPEKSIAVLPFANLSTEKENEFFADGVQDDVITNLAKIRDLTVISRTSTLAYRDPGTRNLKKIAAELNVATVLEGSVARVGNKVHMNAQLIDARTDTHVWADTFDGDASDIFALQASLAQKIAAALKATLTKGERTLIERRPTENQEAYELYTRARLNQQMLGQTAKRAAYEPIVALYEQAIAKDPSFALAFAQLSMVQGLMYWYSAVDQTPERRARAQTALAAAQRLAPDAPETHLALGSFAYHCDNDWPAALAEYALAEPGLPNDAQLEAESGFAHRRLGQLVEAAGKLERAVTLSPQPGTAAAFCGTIIYLRRYEQGRALATRYLALFPSDPTLRMHLAEAQYALDGNRSAYAHARSEAGDLSGAARDYAAAMIAGDLAAAERALADPRLTTNAFVRKQGTQVADSVQLRRAMLAFLNGQTESATKFADDAIEFYRNGVWPSRQQASVLLSVAEAEAYAGRAEAALRDGRAAVAQYRAIDAFSAMLDGEPALGRIYVALGKREDALALLRDMMNAPGHSPQEIRDDPFWSRLKDDPRFEEILKSAKTF